MKKKKILVLFPILGLLLSGCTFQEGLANAKSWVSQHIYHPIKDWITGGGNKEEPSDGGGQQEEKTLQEIVSVSAPASIKKGETLAPSSVDLVVKYSDKSTEAVKAESVDLDTSKVGDAVQGTAHYKTLSKTFTIKVYEEGGGEGEKPEHAGTEADPFDKADALLVGKALEKGEATEEAYYIKDTVTSVKQDFNAQYGNLTFNMGDFLCYRVFKGADKAHFESQDDVQVGDLVTVYSRIKNYNGTIETVEQEGYTTSIVKVDHGKIAKIVSVSGPTEVALNGTITPAEVKVVVEYEDGFQTEVTAKSVVVDTKSPGDKVATVTVEGFDGTGTYSVKVVEGELTNQLEEAYKAAIDLKDDGTEASSAVYYIRGVVVAVRGTDDYFVQSGEYGLDVMKPSSSAEFAVGKEVELKATVANYHGLYETKAITSGSEKVLGEGQLPTPVDVTSKEVHDGLKMNVLSKVTGVLSADVSVVENKDVSISLKVGGSYDLTVFVKKGIVSKFPALSSYKEGDTLSFENVVTGQYNQKKQLLVCNNTVISKAADPTKVVESIIGIEGPTFINVGDPLTASQFTVEVKYTNGSTGKVSATSLGDIDTSKAGTQVPVEVYVGEVHSTYKLDIVEKTSTREALPYTLSISGGALPEGWEGTGEKFDNAYYALKGDEKHMFAKALIDPVTKLDVSILGICNGASKDSTVTVFGLNDSGERIEGASAKFTPDKAVSNNKTAVDENATTKTVSISGANITGVEVELTVKGHNYVIKSITLESNVPTVYVTDVALDVHELNLHLDGTGEQQPSTGTLKATVLPVEATDPTVSWTSSDENVATVSGGVVTAVGAGTATITAKAGDKTDTCIVSVTQHVKSISVSGPLGVVVGETTEEAINVEILPAGAPQGYTLTSSNEAIATIDNEHKIVGVAEGDVIIRATSEDNGLSDEYAVHVSNQTIAITGVEIAGEETQNIYVGGELELSGAVVPNNTTQTPTTLTWSIQSGDSVTLEGSVVTGVKVGDTVIRATSDANPQCYDEVTIHVSKIDVTEVALNESHLDLYAGNSSTLTATVTPEEATYPEVTWASSNKNVATVEGGVVTAVGEGSATITATADGHSATCTVSVSPAPIISTATITPDEFSGSYKENIEHFVEGESGLSVDAFGVCLNSQKIQLRAVDGNLWNGSPITDGITEISFTVDDGNTTPHVYVGNEKNPRTVELSGANGVYTVATGSYSYFAIVTANENQSTKISAITVKYNNVIPEYVIPASKISLNKESIELEVDESFTLIETILPVVASDHTVVWESEDTSVATVDNGVVTGKALGSTVITATVDGVVVSCSVEVKSSVAKVYAAYNITVEQSSTTAYTSSDLSTVKSIFASSCTGTDIVSSVSAVQYVYPENSVENGVGFKFGKSSNGKGSLTLSISEGMSKIVIRAKSYSAAANEVKDILVAGTTVTLTANYAEYIIDLTGAETSIKIEGSAASKNRFFVTNIDFYK